MTYSAQAIPNHDPNIVQRLLRDGQPIGIQLHLQQPWVGMRLDAGTFLDFEALGLASGQVVEVAFGEMEGFFVPLLAGVDQRVLVLAAELPTVVPAGDTVWVLETPVPEAELPPAPPVIPPAPGAVEPNLPFQLEGGADSVEYMKGSLGMTRQIERSAKYHGPGDLSELPAKMKTPDKIPTAYGWQWPKGSRLQFVENDGEEEILLMDVDGNYDHLHAPSGTRTVFQKKRVAVVVPASGIEVHIMCPFLHTRSYEDTQVDVGRDLRITVDQHATVLVKGDADIHVQGNATVTVDQNLTATVKGDTTLEAKRNLVATVGQVARVTAKKWMALRGKQIFLN